MKKVLVTGSMGYIGSVLVPYLSENNFKVAGYDTGFFKDCNLFMPKNQDIILKDMRDFSESDLKNIDVVVHLAGISNDPFGNLSAEKVYNPTRVYSLKLAKMCKGMGIRFIFASSCSIYGKAGQDLVTEESETNPQTPYSLNKLQIENDLKKISDNNFSPIILRFATLFGLSPRIRFDLYINMLIGMGLTQKKIVLNSDGKAWRPNIHILDVCKAVKEAINHEYNYNEPLILNVGDTKQNFRIIKVAKMIRNQIGGCELTYLKLNPYDKSPKESELIKDRKIQDGVDSRTYKVSFERIKTVFKGFKCDWTVEKGIESMIKMFKDLNLTEKEFKNINFYRLQKYEYLFKKNYISENISWNKNTFQGDNI